MITNRDTGSICKGEEYLYLLGKAEEMGLIKRKTTKKERKDNLKRLHKSYHYIKK